MTDDRRLKTALMTCCNAEKTNIKPSCSDHPEKRTRKFWLHHPPADETKVSRSKRAFIPPLSGVKTNLFFSPSLRRLAVKVVSEKGGLLRNPRLSANGPGETRPSKQLSGREKLKAEPLASRSEIEWMKWAAGRSARVAGSCE